MRVSWMVLAAVVALAAVCTQARPAERAEFADADVDTHDEGSGSGTDAESGASETEEASAAPAKVEAVEAEQVDSQASHDDAAKKSESKGDESEEEEEEEEEDEDAGEEDKEDKEKDPTKMAADILPSELLDEKKDEKKKKKKMSADEEDEEEGSADVKKNSENMYSVMLRQNYDDELIKAGSAKFQMLSGNVQKDLEKTVPGGKISDLKFSEATIEGNPPQKGKTKVTFKFEGDAKQLQKIVESGSINGLSVVKNSLDSESE